MPEQRPEPNKKVEAAVTAESIRSSQVVEQAKRQKKFHDKEEEKEEQEVMKPVFKQEEQKPVLKQHEEKPQKVPDTVYHGGKDPDPSKLS
jgi:hypothetical protein